MILKSCFYFPAMVTLQLIFSSQIGLSQERDFSIPENIKNSVDKSVFRIVARSNQPISKLDALYESAGSSVLWNKERDTCSLITAAHVLSKSDNDSSQSLYVQINQVIDLNESISNLDKSQRYTEKYKVVEESTSQDFTKIEITCKGDFVPFQISKSQKLILNNTYYLAGFRRGSTREKPIIIEQTFRETDSRQFLIFDLKKRNLLGGVSGGAILNQKSELVGMHNGADTVVMGPNKSNDPCSIDTRKVGIVNNTRKSCGTSIATLIKGSGTPSASRNVSPAIIPPTPNKNAPIVKSIPIQPIINEQPVIYNQKPLTESDYNVARGQRG